MGNSGSTLEALMRELARTPAVVAFKRPGDTFAGGRYRVERTLGAGGQKVVYLVRDTVLERDCALSLIKPDLVAPQQLKRFRLEAQALARFGAHSHIVTIYDLGEEDGLPYVLCEYLEGGDLRAVLEPGESIAVERALAIARDVCRGLAFAHERGVVHRDVTPANIWFLADGTAKLGDFGLALMSDESRLTRPGGVLGTASYMAPEAALGEAIDPRGDLYSLGCVVYELLAGDPPFTGKPMEIVSQHVHAEPTPVDQKNPEVSPAIAALVARLLAKDPGDRFPSARELLAELERMLAPIPPGPHPVPADEAGRLAALHELGVLDTPREVAYDELAELAAHLCDTPLAYICFVDETRQWMKAYVGFPPEMASAPREIGVCQTTICQGDVVIVPDLAVDDRFRHLPPVTEPPYVRFYCGAPLLTPEGHAVGTICVMDLEPRELGYHQIEGIRRLARQVVTRFELVKARAELDETRRELAEVRDGGASGGARVEPRYHDSLTVGVIDWDGFAERAINTAPARLLDELDAHVSRVDTVIRERGLDKLKTFGGRYLFAGGLSGPGRRHLVDACLAALALRRASRSSGSPIRIALHSGPAISGVIGSWKPEHGVWGRAANVAVRLVESVREERIVVSESVFERVKPLFDGEPGGHLEVEDRGRLALFSLERIKPELSADADGCEPNGEFTALAARLFGD